MIFIPPFQARPVDALVHPSGRRSRLARVGSVGSLFAVGNTRIGAEHVGTLRAMILSDRSIRDQLASGRLGITPLDEELIQPSSIDVRLARIFRVFHNHRTGIIDVRAPMDELTEEVIVEDHEAFILHPGEFVLASTLERVAIPDDVVARLEGKSSLGRLGLLIHSTAGFIDPGFHGDITLELSNVARLPIALYPNMRIGQLSFNQLSTPADNPYRGNYQGQAGPTSSVYHTRTPLLADGRTR